jgi:hypothetical protein
VAVRDLRSDPCAGFGAPGAPAVLRRIGWRDIGVHKADAIKSLVAANPDAALDRAGKAEP